MDRIGIRELRNRVSDVVRRAQHGERIVITRNGIPVAELGPILGGRAESITELAEAGLLRLPRSDTRPPHPRTLPVRDRLTSDEILEDLRSR